jgi:hypothetical protein
MRLDFASLDRIATTRPFRIVVRNCRRCGREWPGYLEVCRDCAAVLGEARVIPGERVVPPSAARDAEPALVAALALELSRRNPYGGRDWAPRLWDAVGPALAGALRVRPGPAGSIVAVWQLEHPESIAEVAALALNLRDETSLSGPERTELRGGLTLGVIDGGGRADAVERCAERLALAASVGQWLASEEAARRLEHRFELRGGGLVSRWPMGPVGRYRSLFARIRPPVLPSAVSGEVPERVLGRDSERRRLSAELVAAASGQRKVLVVCAPAGGGKSYLLRRVLADCAVAPAAGVAFPPLGSRPLDPVRSLLADLGGAEGADRQDLGAALAHSANQRARIEPSAIVIDDLHWASPEAVSAVRGAIAASDDGAPLAWILSMRTSSLAALSQLVELADLTVELPPLDPEERAALLAQRLGSVPDRVRAHVATGAERGNPLYLEHLAAAIQEGSEGMALPGTLHEAVMTRLDHLVERARVLTHWSQRRYGGSTELEALERRLGDWLDRLETTDVADLATIGRYLGRLRAVDFELVLARSLLGMPIAANRRLAGAVERLSAASTDSLVDYLETVARGGKAARAAYEARVAADRAERSLRLVDADRLLAFASGHDADREELAGRSGDLALALGRPGDALGAYLAASASDSSAQLQRRIARAEALLGQLDAAESRLEALASRDGGDPLAGHAAALDLARIRGLPPAPSDHPLPQGLARRVAITAAWARAGEPGVARRAIRGLVLDGEPALCAAELIEFAALSRFAGVTVAGLEEVAAASAEALGNPYAATLLHTTDVALARRTFIHWDG